MAECDLAEGLATVLVDQEFVVTNQEEPVQLDPLDTVTVRVGSSETISMRLKQRHLGHLSCKKNPDGLFLLPRDDGSVVVLAIEVKQTLNAHQWEKATAQCVNGIRFARATVRGMPMVTARTHLRWAILYGRKVETDPQWLKLAAARHLDVELPDGVESAAGFIRQTRRDELIPIEDLAQMP